MPTVQTEFGPFRLDGEARQLFRGDVELHLSPKAFDLLSLLIEERPKVLDRRDLHAHIWPDTHVVDANLNVLIAEIRRTLGDSAQQPRYIRTVHGVGFAFCAKVTRGATAAGTAETMRCWLVSSDSTFRLKEGDNIIGRDPLCDVFLDTPGVSRRHAAIRVDSRAKTVVLSDLGSTNGTFIRRLQISGPATVEDEDDIAIASVELKVRLRRSDTLPETQRIPR